MAPLDALDAEVVERLGLPTAAPEVAAEGTAADLASPPPFATTEDDDEEYGAPAISGEFVVVDPDEPATEAPSVDGSEDVAAAAPVAVETPLGADVHLVVTPGGFDGAAEAPSGPPSSIEPPAGVDAGGEEHGEAPHGDASAAPVSPNAAAGIEGNLADPALASAEGATGTADVGAPAAEPAPEATVPRAEVDASIDQVADRDIPATPEGATEVSSDASSDRAATSASEPASESPPDASGVEAIASGPSLFIPRLTRDEPPLPLPSEVIVDDEPRGAPEAPSPEDAVHASIEVVEDAEEIEAEELLEEATDEQAPPVAPPPAPRERRRRKHWADSVFGDAYPSLEPEDMEEVAKRDAAFIVEQLGLEPGARILDVGSGSGHLALAFGELGFSVLGVDNSLPQVLRASERLATRPELEERVSFMHGDMRALPTDETFDAVVCIGTTFGYFEEEVNRQVLEHLRDHVRPGGGLALQIINRDHLVSRLPVRSWWQGRNCMVLDEAEMNFFANRLRVHRTVVFDDGRQYEHYMFIRAYTLHDIGKLVSSTGLAVQDVSGSRHTPGRFFGATSPDIWIFAQRPADDAEE
ncbi:MAG: methyltransferase domain-containing protein [Deltaproteobacteria bacterium]|nr:MAG: methyltransferase domain-containing protein [Deltaproteobacteria bacterium]